MREIYCSPSKVLIDGIDKSIAMVSNSECFSSLFILPRILNDVCLMQHHHYMMGLVDQVQDAKRVIDHMSNIIDELQGEVRVLKAGSGPEAICRGQGIGRRVRGASGATKGPAQ